jgi:SOS-response transcriptional repressor LexA
MSGRIESGQLVTLHPVAEGDRLEVGDIVLCKVNGKHWLHLVKSMSHDERYLIGNNKGHLNGWCNRTAIYGRVTDIE